MHVVFPIDIPMRGTESDWGGIVSATSSKNTVRARRTVTPRDTCKIIKSVITVKHWDEDIVILIKFSSQAALEIVNWTTRMFVIKLIQDMKDTTKALQYWPFMMETHGDRWILLTKCQYYAKCVHMMTSSWNKKSKLAFSPDSDGR